MSRFELVDSTSDAGPKFYITDTKTRRSYEAPDSFERASHALMTLNALKPTWFASTYQGRAFVDMRVMVGGHQWAGSRIIDPERNRSTVPMEALKAVIRSVESDLHKYVALHG